MVGVTLKSAAKARGVVHHFADRFAHFIRSATKAEPLRVAHRLSCLHIEEHQCGRESMREIRRDMADCPRLALDVKERDAAFRSRIKFKNLWNRKPFLEAFPYARRQSVATGHPNAMCSLIRRGGGME